MPWSTPRVWATAELVTAANMNTYISEDLSVLRAGGIAIASQAAGDFLFASSSTQLARLAAGGAFSSLRRNAAGSAYEFYQPWSPRMVVTGSASSITPDLGAGDVFEFTALAANLTINAPVSGFVDGERFMFRIKDNGTPRTLTWNAVFSNGGVAIPTVTVAGKVLHVIFMHKVGISHYCIGVAQEP